MNTLTRGCEHGFLVTLSSGETDWIVVLDDLWCDIDVKMILETEELVKTICRPVISVKCGVRLGIDG